MFTDLGFLFEPLQLAELGLDIHLDWNRGIELISPIPGIHRRGRRFGDGIPRASWRWRFHGRDRSSGSRSADDIAERYGATTRFRQRLEGEGTYLDENDVSVLGLPLTFLATNFP